eukprot:4530006-Pleurochrysis_carterae.AAC.1
MPAECRRGSPAPTRPWRRCGSGQRGDVEVPSVPTVVIEQSEMAPWARGRCMGLRRPTTVRAGAAVNPANDVRGQEAAGSSSPSGGGGGA